MSGGDKGEPHFPQYRLDEPLAWPQERQQIASAEPQFSQYSFDILF
jgi:hypothetical protein